MAEALIALGANLGERTAALDAAVAALRAHPAIDEVVVSRWHATSPIGGPDGQSAFLNGAARVCTSLSPEALLELLQQIEADRGRERLVRWDARTLDLDLLLYDDRTLAAPTLSLPHPRMAWRRFVLAPAVEVAAAWVHPTTGLTLAELLANLDRQPHVLLVYDPQRQAADLAARVAARTGAALLAAPTLPPPEAATVLYQVDRRAAEDFPVVPTLLAQVGRAAVPCPAWRCPVLRLDLENRDNAETELVAAIEAMR